MTDAEWKLIEPLMPGPARRGRLRIGDPRRYRGGADEGGSFQEIAATDLR